MTIYTLTMQEFLSAMYAETKPVWWEDIYAEFLSERINRDNSYILDLLKEIAHLENKEFIIGQCIIGLSYGYSQVLAMEIKQAGFMGRLDPSDKIGYSNNLRAASSFNKKFRGQISRKRKELEDYYAKQGDKSSKRSDWDAQAVELSRFMGFRIDHATITISEYCQICNKFDAYNEVQNAQHNNMIKKGGYNG